MNRLKRVAGGAGGCALVLLLTSCASGANGQAARAASTRSGARAQPAERTITVTGYGEANMTPDAFVLEVSVSHRDKELDKARQEVLDVSKRVLQAIKPFPVDPQRTCTTDFGLEPDYSWQTEEFLGYNASQKLQVYLADTEQADELTFAVLQAGATELETHFIAKDDAALWPQAREKAVRDARAKAAAIAAALGQKLGSPLQIDLQWERRGEAGERQTASLFAIAERRMAGGAPERVEWIAPTRVGVSATVQVKFALLAVDESPGTD